MCDKRTMERNKINKRKRKQREISIAMAREIEMRELDATSISSPNSSHQVSQSYGDHRRPSAAEYTDLQATALAIGQQERNDNAVPAEEEDGSRLHEDRTEPEQEERRDDRTESVDEQEQISSQGSESADTEEEGGSDESDFVEEQEEVNEYDELRDWAINCNIPQKNLDELLAILRRRLLPNLPKSSKTFLKTDSCPYLINETEHGQFVYFGLENGLQTCINEALHPGNEIFLQLNVDGMPIFKSSAKQLWPILCRVHCPQSDLYTPFAVACYCGDTKPQDLIHYFHEFIEEINKLQRDGLIINTITYKVHIKCFICDSPARALLKNVKGHGGFSACERCTIYGERVRKNRGFCTVYPEVNKQRRTNESFRNMDDASHHNGISPLLDIDPPIDMIKDFLLDKLHLFDGGAMKKVLEYWTAGDLRVRLGRRSKQELDRRISSLRSQIPSEFQRKPRTINHLARWKCTEFRLFLLYIGPIVLKKILPSVLYKHFLLLHVAARILCSEDLALKYNRNAKMYLEKFVLASRQLYGAHSQSLNTHNLIHVADDAKNMGCSLSCISAYPFESQLGKLKKSIRTAHLPLAQICRRMHEAELIQSKRPIISNQIEIIKTKVNDNGIEQAIKVRYRSSILTNMAPDNIVLLTDSTIVQIDRMIILSKNPDMVKIEGREWEKNRSLYNYPCDSKHVRVWELRSMPVSAIGTCRLDSIVTKMMKISLSLQPDGRKMVYALALLHTQ